MTVRVTGASGTTGSAVVDQLVAAGVPVRATTRSAATADTLRRPGVAAVVASPDDPATLAAAFAGVSAAYVATPSAPEMAATEGAYANAAAAAGAHLVKLSVIGASSDSPLRFARGHAEAESAVEASGVDWTFVQPNGFMQNDLAWAAQIPSGTVAGPVMDASWSIVDVQDVAAVAVAALNDPHAYAGRRIAVTGPEGRTPRDRVHALGRILGKELQVVDVPLAAARDQFLGYGIPEWYVDGLMELFELYTTGLAADVAPDVDKVLGRPARSWEQFVTDHAPAFGG